MDQTEASLTETDAAPRAPGGAPARGGGHLVSIVVPVFNEEAMIPVYLGAMEGVLAEMRAALGPGGRTEIVFVDDGSRDGTAAAVREAALAGVAIRLVRLSRNFGKDAALAAGLAHARGDAVVPMDVDLQDPPGILPDMVAAWMGGARIVNAVRADRSTDGWVKRMGARAFYAVFDRLATYPVHPNVGDCRLLDREVVDVVNRMPERVRFMKGLFSWLGYRPVEIPYHREARAAGESKWKLWALWNFALDGITGSTTLPLRIWTYFGGAMAVLALGFATWIVLRTLIWGVDVPGYASLMVVVLTLSAINLVALGILGEYIGRIAVEVRQRPLYLVETVEEIDAAGA